MAKSTQIDKSIQMKFHAFLRRTTSDFSKPESRFLKEMFFGILSCTHVHASKIGRHIQDRISLKKTLKRLSYHLHKKDLWIRLQRSYLKNAKSRLANSRFLVIDLSDITKQYATKMEGMYRVHDGSNKENTTGNGFWTIGVIGCEANAQKRNRLEIHPLYTELFSYHSEKEDKYISENGKILAAMNEVDCGINSSAYWVADRGLCRRKIIEPCLKKGRHFILRSDGKLNLWYDGKSQSIRNISRQVLLKQEQRVIRKHKNRYKWRCFKMGAVPVRWVNEYTKEPQDDQLWLVVAKEKNRGYCWFLVNSLKKEAAAIIKDVSEGYSARWQIEEVYRHIKVQFHLEEVAYRKYEAIKNILPILWIALAFVYNHVVELSVDILTCKDYKIVHGRSKIKELYRFIYYKLAEIVKRCFLKTGCLNIREPIRRNINCINFQLQLLI